MASNGSTAKGSERIDKSRTFPLQFAKIPILEGEHILLIDVEDIFYIRGAGDYTSIQTSQKNLLCTLTLNELEQRLHDKSFFRVHRSFIANLNKCEFICLGHGRRYLQLCDRASTKIPISRGKVKMLRDFIGF